MDQWIDEETTLFCHLSKSIKLMIPDHLYQGTFDDIKVKNILKIIPHKFEQKNDQHIYDHLECVCMYLKNQKITNESFNAIIFGTLCKDTVMKVGRIDLSQSALNFLMRIHDKLSKSESIVSLSLQFWNKTPKHKTNLTDWFDQISLIGRRANMSLKDIWVKFLDPLPMSLHTQLGHALKEYVLRTGTYPSDSFEFLQKNMGSSKDRFLLYNHKEHHSIKN